VSDDGSFFGHDTCADVVRFEIERLAYEGECFDEGVVTLFGEEFDGDEEGVTGCAVD
jgi:hypothetical protein